MSQASEISASPWSPVLRRELEKLFHELDEEIRFTGAACRQRGECCDFTRAEHILYASGLELSFIRELHPRPFPAGSKLCPFWKGGLCTLRDRRPLGCRTYFCDGAVREELERLHEKYHRRLKDLAERYQVPWMYRPLVEALRSPDP